MIHTDFLSRFVRPQEGFYTSEVSAPGGMPLRIFLPTGYEPNYSYPLLVFLHGQGGNEEQILRLAPFLSRRNYICIALRGPRPLGPRPDGQFAFSWGQLGRDNTLVEDYLFQALEQTQEGFRIHPERIYLAGFCEGASLAYRLGLLYSDYFAGVIAMNGCLPRYGAPVLRMPQIRRLRILIAHGIANAVVPLSMARKDYQVLYSAGASVKLNTYPTTHRIHPDMLRDANRWVMQSIDTYAGMTCT